MLPLLRLCGILKKKENTLDFTIYFELKSILVRINIHLDSRKKMFVSETAVAAILQRVEHARQGLTIKVN